MVKTATSQNGESQNGDNQNGESQNGDKPKRRKSKRRQAEENITETATKTRGPNGDTGQQNAYRKFTLRSTRRHDSG